MRILLVQTREEDDLREEEFSSICRLAHISENTCECWDGKRVPKEEQLDGVDAICIAGSGTHSVTTDAPLRVEAFSTFLHAARARHIPMLGIDYGCYLLVVAFGGSVSHNPLDKEIGISTIMQNEAALTDPLFSQMPKHFSAIVAHLDRIISMPPGAVCLADTKAGRCEAWTFPGEPIYGVAFHPELNDTTMTQRLVYYQDRFSSEPGELEHVVLHLKPTPEANRLLTLFFSGVRDHVAA